MNLMDADEMENEADTVKGGMMEGKCAMKRFAFSHTQNPP